MLALGKLQIVLDRKKFTPKEIFIKTKSYDHIYHSALIPPGPGGGSIRAVHMGQMCNTDNSVN